MSAWPKRVAHFLMLRIKSHFVPREYITGGRFMNARRSESMSLV